MHFVSLIKNDKIILRIEIEFMAKIRNLALRDIPKLKKMISMISNLSSADVSFGYKTYVPFPLNLINRFLPLRFKFAQDSYVAIEDKKLCGLVTLKPQEKNPQSWRISKLFLDENGYDIGRQLVSFVIAKYGAMGANTFSVKVDESHEELLELFSKGCGFRACSSEQLWKMEEIKLSTPSLEKGFFRPFKNSDASVVAGIYNELIYPHFRYSLAKKPCEFENVLFCGLHDTSFFRYVIEDRSKHSIKGYFSIQTDDNENFILNVDLVSAFDEYLSDVINFSISQIMMRKRVFNLYFRNKKYQTNGTKTEKYLKENGFKNIKNQIVLVKDYYKRVQEDERYSKPAIAFSEITRKPAFKSTMD